MLHAERNFLIQPFFKLCKIFIQKIEKLTNFLMISLSQVWINFWGSNKCGNEILNMTVN